MINHHSITKQNIEKHNLSWTQILEDPYIILIIGVLGSRKSNALPNLIKQQNDDDDYFVDKMYLCVKDPNEAKYQNLIKKHKRLVLTWIKIQRL